MKTNTNKLAAATKPFKVTHKPITDIKCRACKRGVLWSVQLSRLEEGLGHEGYACDKCRNRIKYVPKNER